MCRPSTATPSANAVAMSRKKALAFGSAQQINPWQRSSTLATSSSTFCTFNAMRCIPSTLRCSLVTSVPCSSLSCKCMPALRQLRRVFREAYGSFAMFAGVVSKGSAGAALP